MSHAADIVDVAVGVLYDGAGRVLVNRRPAGKAFAGLWEFPGGKIEAGETITQALARELHEELGISIEQQRELIAFIHDYGTLTVRLHVNEILSYEGAAESREGQDLDWVTPEDLNRTDLLPANAPIVRAVQLPRVCLITDLQRFGADHTMERLVHHVTRQRLLLIVREKELERQRLVAFVRQALHVCRPGGSLVVVHADCDLAEHDTVDGIHLSSGMLEQHAGPATTGLVGASCHSKSELALALQRGCDYALLSPVETTESHPSVPPLGWAEFARLSRNVALPIYALGGLKLSDFDTAREHGAQGVALLSAAWR